MGVTVSPSAVSWRIERRLVGKVVGRSLWRLLKSWGRVTFPQDSSRQRGMELT
jgi:hypothetical protein